MWPLPHVRRDIVSLSFTPSHLTCSWIKPTRQACAPYALVAHKSIPLAMEAHKLILFNPTKLHATILTFINTYALTNASAVVSVTGPHIAESMVNLKTSNPVRADFRAQKLKSLVWDFRYVHPQEDGTFAFYVCGIPQNLLFQYTLFGMQLPLHVLTITTQQMAWLRLYRHVHGDAFRPAQLARDVARTSNQLHACFTPDILRRVIIAPHKFEPNELPTLTQSVGLYLIGEDMYEAN